MAIKKSINDLKDLFSKYRKKNCLTDKTVYDEEPHNKDIQNEIKNENVFKNQEKEVQLKTSIARYNFDSPNTYSNFQLNSYVGEDMKRSGQTVKDNSYIGTKFDDSKSTRRFAHNIFNQNILSDELKTIIDHKSQTKSEKFDQPKDPNIIINSDGKYVQMNNYNEISYDYDDDGENRSSSRELEKLNNNIANQLRDPTKGLGISKMTKSHMMIMKHPRVCYACSSINDFSCWTPNRLTSVKYCHEDHTSCLTKMYKDKDVRYITRDCGSACVPSTRHEFKLKYDFCTICHADLCALAHSLLSVAAWVEYNIEWVPAIDNTPILASACRAERVDNTVSPSPLSEVI
ncbi:uncharacterized protein LOC125070116 [Vanessa atalanta]|uniref:uncharacterized protein LOC125070116 n=1 Tax=Vanessa atalanta TaxID=42275 RepID=UPI001FCDB8A0|nr:uncharacterized protein LOC125070116 [Vanessa atalanta]